MVFKLADVLEALTGQPFPKANLVLSEASIDSRQVIPAALFVALPGERVDGHNFIDVAFKRGAAVALVQKDLSGQFPTLDLRSHTLPENTVIPSSPFCIQVENTLEAFQTIAAFWRGKFTDLRVIGITGSIGKSTTKELVSEVLSQRYCTLKNTGNLNNEIGLPLTMLRLSPGYERAVLEMGFYNLGEIAFLCKLAHPVVGVVTNVGTVHAERVGSSDVIAQGKTELVQALPPEGVAILNYDDQRVRAMADKTSARVLFYGLEPAAHLWADQIESAGLEGIRFRLHYQNEVLHLRVPIVGRHSVHTVLRAAAVGLTEGMDWGEIITGLQYGRNQLRLVAVRTENGAMVLDDSYNAAPESTLAALNLLEEISGRKIAVLGDMLELGPYEQSGHEMVGTRVAEVCSQLVAVGERSKITAHAAAKAGMPSSAIHWFPTAPDTIDFLKSLLAPGDVALVKGSLGMKMSQIVNALEAGK